MKYIIGAGALGIFCAELLTTDPSENVVFIDDNKELWGKTLNGIQIVGGMEYLITAQDENKKVLVAIANPIIREKIFNEVNTKNIQFFNLIHPTALILPSVEIGQGCMFMPQSIVCSNAKIGNGVIINMGSIVEQSCVIADFVGLAPGVNIGGRTEIRKRSLIATGATVFARIVIEEQNVIAANAVVTKSTSRFSYLKGAPAKYISSTEVGFEWSTIF